MSEYKYLYTYIKFEVDVVNSNIYEFFKLIERKSY